MKLRKAFITGVSSTSLKEEEISFLKKYKPWGVILFSRNIKDVKQTRRLTGQIRSCFKDSKYPILVDEEGGEVSRISKIIDTRIFSSKYFGNLFQKNKNEFLQKYKVYINNISEILKIIGININTVPVLDVIRKKTNKIIGSRSFSGDARIVSKLGDYCIEHYSKNRIGTVIKHIPGHGLSSKDSHISTPIINKKKKILNKIDFKAFKKKRSLFAMTAHIVYSHYDKKNPATHSKTIIGEVIRKKIKFKNLLISDDISMKALKYDLSENATKSLEAGCNIVLHCNGKMKEMEIVAKTVPKVDNFILKKTSQFYNFLM